MYYVYIYLKYCFKKRLIKHLCNYIIIDWMWYLFLFATKLGSWYFVRKKMASC